MENSELIIYWFRQDLRLSDNPALVKAAAAGVVMPIYILDDDNAGKDAMGGASRLWLHHSLASLNNSLGGNLNIYKGNAEKIIKELVKNHSPKAVYWNRCYEPWRIKRDTAIKNFLNSAKIQTESFNGSLLWEPWEIHKDDGSFYRVFTPFYKRGCLNAQKPRQPIAKPDFIKTFRDNNAINLENLNLLPKIDWHKQIEKHWQIGEESAQNQLYDFLRDGIKNYKEGRNFPALANVSRLSSHLHFGEISPNQAWYAAKASGDDVNIDSFCSELGWREFSYHLLYQFPDLRTKNLQSKFDNFPWQNNSDFFEKWKNGKTGYPIIDAGMRELWQTGYMHNRVRMIVGSFLVKNLQMDWRKGENWFWDCLLDADHANNSASWQWIAGCGADAAPYFRVFNPITQGEKFDSSGVYIRRFVPEIAKLPDKYLCKPWAAPSEILAKAGIIIGKDYPAPIVDVAESRNQALMAFAKIKIS